MPTQNRRFYNGWSIYINVSSNWISYNKKQPNGEVFLMKSKYNKRLIKKVSNNSNQRNKRIEKINRRKGK